MRTIVTVIVGSNNIGTEDKPEFPGLIYNHARWKRVYGGGAVAGLEEIYRQMVFPATDRMIEAMDGRAQAYFHVEIGDGAMNFMPNGRVEEATRIEFEHPLERTVFSG